MHACASVLWVKERGREKEREREERKALERGGKDKEGWVWEVASGTHVCITPTSKMSNGVSVLSGVVISALPSLFPLHSVGQGSTCSFPSSPSVVSVVHRFACISLRGRSASEQARQAN